MVPRLRALTQRTLTLLTLSTATAAGAGYLYLNSGPAYPQTTHESRRPPPSWSPPPRAAMIDALKRSTDPKRGEDDAQFDILVVGGGATGAGVAVDAASRGLRVALVEREDFASGKSIRFLSCNLTTYVYHKVRPPSQRSLSMVACATSRKPYSNLTTSSTNSFARLCAKGGSSYRLPLI